MTTDIGDAAGDGIDPRESRVHPRRQTYIKPRIPGDVWFYGITSGVVVSSGLALLVLTWTTP